MEIVRFEMKFNNPFNLYHINNPFNLYHINNPFKSSLKPKKGYVDILKGWFKKLDFLFLFTLPVTLMLVGELS